jgi:hypothetical protein
MKVEQGELTLSSGQKATYEYESDTDLLEIFFQRGEATAAVELAESIILRFDWATEQPLSLSFISAAHLVKPTIYGEPNYQLLVDEWPDLVREKVWRMLRTAPLNEFLLLRSYTPAHSSEPLPMATIQPLALTPLAMVPTI